MFKRVLLVLAATMAVLVILATGGLYVYFNGVGGAAEPAPLPHATPAPGSPTIKPTGAATASPSPTTTPISVLPDATQPAMAVQPTQPEPVSATVTAATATPAGNGPPPSAPPTATPPPAPVSFSLNVRQNQPPETTVLFNVKAKIFLGAELTNLGDLDAHDVFVTARARVGVDYIAIDGKDALVVPIGELAAQTTIQRDLEFELRMSLSQGRAAESQGIIFEVTVSSAEAVSPIPPMRCDQTGCATI